MLFTKKYCWLFMLIPLFTKCFSYIHIIERTIASFDDRVTYNNKDKSCQNCKFFIENENQRYKGFREFKNKCLVTHLPFANIVNFDFKEYLEYEPIFYTKYPHNNLELYNTALYLRERLNDPYFSKELTKGKFLKKYSKINHVILRIKLLSLENFFKTKSINNGHNN